MRRPQSAPIVVGGWGAPICSSTGALPPCRRPKGANTSVPSLSALPWRLTCCWRLPLPLPSLDCRDRWTSSWEESQQLSPRPQLPPSSVSSCSSRTRTR